MNYNISAEDLSNEFEVIHFTQFKNKKIACPWHNDKNPSLSVYNKSGVGKFHCHTCKKHGDVYDLLKENGKNFNEANLYLHNKYGVALMNKKTAENIACERSEYEKLEEFALKKTDSSFGEITKIYRYKHKSCYMLKIRSANKNFRWFHREKSMNNIGQMEGSIKIYRYEELNKTIRNKNNKNSKIFILEGEKDVDNFRNSFTDSNYTVIHIDGGLKEREHFANITEKFIGEIFIIYDNDILTYTGYFKMLKIYEMLSKETQNRTHKIKPLNKDFSEDLNKLGKYQACKNIDIQITNRENCSAHYEKDKMGRIRISDDNMATLLFDKCKLTLGHDVITGEDIAIHAESNEILVEKIYSLLPFIKQYNSTVIRNLDVHQKIVPELFANQIDRNPINIFKLKMQRLSKHANKDEFDRFINAIPMCGDKNDISISKDILKLFFTLTVKRAIERNGVPMKIMICFSGGQSRGKTSFVQNLFHGTGCEKYASTGMYFDSSSKDLIQQITSCVFCEIGEFVGTRKYANELKNFLSKSFDVYRPAYARKAVSIPRVTGFIGTTNEEYILKDETGNTRIYTIFLDNSEKFMPVPKDYNMKAVWGHVYNMAVQSDQSIFNIEKKFVDYAMKQGDDYFDKDDMAHDIVAYQSPSGDKIIYNRHMIANIFDTNISDSKWKRLKSSMDKLGYPHKPHYRNQKSTRGFLLRPLCRSNFANDNTTERIWDIKQ